MRSARWVLAAAAALGTMGTGWAVEGDGLRAKDSAWPRWQARLSIGTISPLLHPDALRSHNGSNSLTLLGDYYFTRSLPRLGGTGGFRATSGILLGLRSTPLLSGGPGGRSLNVEQRNSSWTLPADSQESGAVAYVGVGYTGLYGRSGWSFSADFGLVGTQTGTRVRLGRSATGQQNLDEAVRELRLSPLLQFGVSYSF
jgi:hypothetical protein